MGHKVKIFVKFSQVIQGGGGGHRPPTTLTPAQRPTLCFTKAILIAVALFFVRDTALANTVSSVRVLPNRITPAFLVSDALHRTFRQEQSENGQRKPTNISSGARPTVAHARLRRPVLISRGAATFTAPRGPVAAFDVVVLACALIHGVAITSLYSYVYNRRTGALLQQSFAPASAAVARAHNFPVNPF